MDSNLCRNGTYTKRICKKLELLLFQPHTADAPSLKASSVRRFELQQKMRRAGPISTFAQKQQRKGQSVTRIRHKLQQQYLRLKEYVDRFLAHVEANAVLARCKTRTLPTAPHTISEKKEHLHTHRNNGECVITHSGTRYAGVASSFGACIITVRSTRITRTSVCAVSC